MSQNVRARIIVTGLVQGVYYRLTTKQQAKNLNVTGWIKNNPDGTVEALLEGKRENVIRLIEWCRQGPPASRVSGVHVEWEDFKDEYQDFRIVG